jgi:HSP20 family molecular chaperone IbpA
MNGVKDTERLGNIQIQNIKRRQSRETETLEEAHRNHKSELKRIQESEIIDVQGENHRSLGQEADKKEKVLADMRLHLQNSKWLTDRELRELKEYAERENLRTSERLTNERNKINSENELYLAEINDRYAAQTMKVNREGKGEVNKMNENMLEQYADLEGYNQKRLQDQTNNFTTRFNHENKEQKRLFDETQRNNKKELLSTNKRQQVELSKMTESHTDYMLKRDGEFRRGIKEQDTFYDKKYLANHASHTKDANNLDGRYFELINKMKVGLAKEVEKTSDKKSDPFYQFTDLQPNWKQTEEGVEITVTVPEYSKQDLQITTNGKEAVLSFHRRYTDANQAPDGTKHKVNKIETFTSRIQTGVILDPKTIKSSYNSGVMTYTIKRT